jgi:hypothetical protein
VVVDEYRLPFTGLNLADLIGIGFFIYVTNGNNTWGDDFQVTCSSN